MNTKEMLLDKIHAFQPTDGNWLELDALLDELWKVKVTQDVLPVLFGVFERFPEDDGAGVLWSIVHGIESLELDYEFELQESLECRSSFMGNVMLKRLEKEKANNHIKRTR